jgi:hypothetical protein
MPKSFSRPALRLDKDLTVCLYGARPTTKDIIKNEFDEEKKI